MISEEDKAALRAMEASYQAQKTAFELLTFAREQQIRAVNSRGGSIREIAAELGVSFQLVGRLIGRRSHSAPAAS